MPAAAEVIERVLIDSKLTRWSVCPLPTTALAAEIVEALDSAGHLQEKGELHEQGKAARADD